jgi:hypothetical protein
MLPDFFKRMWLCGTVVSIVSVLLSIASLFFSTYLTMSRQGLHSIPDKRMSIREIWDWQRYILHAGCEICFVGAIFAVFGGAACLVFRLSRVHLPRTLSP